MMMEFETYPEEEPEDHQESENPADRMRRITAEPEDPEPETIIAPRDELEEATASEDDQDAFRTTPSDAPDEPVTLVAPAPDVPTLTSPTKPDLIDDPDEPAEAAQSEETAPDAEAAPAAELSAPEPPLVMASVETTLAEMEGNEAEPEDPEDGAPDSLPAEIPLVTMRSDDTEITAHDVSTIVGEETFTEDLEPESETGTPTGLPGLTGAWFVQEGSEKVSGIDEPVDGEIMEGDRPSDELSATFADEDLSPPEDHFLVGQSEEEAPASKSDTVPSGSPDSPLDFAGTAASHG